MQRDMEYCIIPFIQVALNVQIGKDRNYTRERLEKSKELGLII